MADQIFAPAPVVAAPAMPVVESPIVAALQQTLATGKATKLSLAQAAEVETNNGNLLAGSDMRVDDQIVEWAEKQIEAGQPATFQATVSTDFTEYRKTSPTSRSQGTRGYFVCDYSANFGKVIPFKALKPRGTIIMGQVVTVTVTKGEQGWNYNVKA